MDVGEERWLKVPSSVILGFVTDAGEPMVVTYYAPRFDGHRPVRCRNDRTGETRVLDVRSQAPVLPIPLVRAAVDEALVPAGALLSPEPWTASAGRPSASRVPVRAGAPRSGFAGGSAHSRA